MPGPRISARLPGPPRRALSPRSLGSSEKLRLFTKSGAALPDRGVCGMLAEFFDNARVVQYRLCTLLGQADRVPALGHRRCGAVDAELFSFCGHAILLPFLGAIFFFIWV